MKLLIAYASKYGCTEKAAEKLAEYTTHVTGDTAEDIKIVNLREKNTGGIDLNAYGAVAVGGPIYAGNIMQEVKDFCSENREALLEKRLGLFICGGMEEKAEEQLKNSFPEELLDQAAARGYFGYEFNLEKLNFLARMIVKKLAKVKESQSEIREDSIKEFARELSGGIA